MTRRQFVKEFLQVAAGGAMMGSLAYGLTHDMSDPHRFTQTIQEEIATEDWGSQVGWSGIGSAGALFLLGANAIAVARRNKNVSSTPAFNK